MSDSVVDISYHTASEQVRSHFELRALARTFSSQTDPVHRLHSVSSLQHSSNGTCIREVVNGKFRVPPILLFSSCCLFLKNAANLKTPVSPKVLTSSPRAHCRVPCLPYVRCPNRCYIPVFEGTYSSQNTSVEATHSYNRWANNRKGSSEHSICCTQLSL